MFNTDSIVVKTWVTLVKNETYTKQQVPNLQNLREVVFSVLEV